MNKVLFCLIVIAITLLSSQQASACLCAMLENPTPEQVRAQFARELNEASAVFSGEVVRLDRFKVTFRVGKMWKGEAAEEITLLTGTKDNGDGTITVSSCDYRFEPGESYLVYATGPGAEMQAYQCSGTSRLKDAGTRAEFLGDAKAKREGPAEGRLPGKLWHRPRNLTTG